MNDQNKKTNVNTRALITEMLMEIENGKEYSHILLRNVLDKYNYLEEHDKAFMKRVLDGTLERRIQIDYILNSVSSVPVKKMKPFIRSLMRMSVYQILFMDKIPDSAACNEAVKLAEKKKFSNLKGFINGVLRNVARRKDIIEYPNEQQSPVEALSVMYSMPEYIVTLLKEEYGFDKTKDILQGLLEEHPICVRMKEHISKQDKEDAFREWQESGTTYEKHPYLSYAYILKNMEQIAAKKGFMQGLYTVQDLSSMLVCEVADIKTGDFVLDVCAAPGGKCLHASDKLAECGHVEARDVSEYKISLIETNSKRMKAENIEIKLWDATVLDSNMLKKADIVFADVPCSGIGVIGKKPDIKYNLTPQSLETLSILQKDIMDIVWQYVKPGGTLIYSTCTIHKAENQDMVSYLTQNYPLKAESISAYLPKELRSETTNEGYIQILPDQKMDGFFIAKLKRVN